MSTHYIVTADKVGHLSPVRIDQLDLRLVDYFDRRDDDNLTKEISDSIIRDIEENGLVHVTEAEVAEAHAAFINLERLDNTSHTRFSNTEFYISSNEFFDRIVDEVCSAPDSVSGRVRYYLLSKSRMEALINLLQAEKERRQPNFEAECLAAELFSDASFWAEDARTYGMSGEKLEQTLQDFNHLLRGTDFAHKYVYIYKA